jgi:hypothetical protein
LSVLIEPAAPDGFVAHSFAGDDDMLCKDYVKERLGYERWEPGGGHREPCYTPVWTNASNGKKRTLASNLWHKSLPISGTPAERYLRECRGYPGPIPATLRYLPPTEKYPPAMIAAFAVAQEPQPGVLSVPPATVHAVHLTRLKPDGSGKADVASPKIILGRSAAGVPIMLAAPNDLLGLAITEGIEDALSIHAATGLGAWAAGCAGRLEPLAPAVPNYIDTVTIYGDGDKSGIDGATALLRRLYARRIFAQIKLFCPGREASNG